MKLKKILAIALSCSLLWETPLVPQANSGYSQGANIQTESTGSHRQNPSKAAGLSSGSLEGAEPSALSPKAEETITPSKDKVTALPSKEGGTTAPSGDTGTSAPPSKDAGVPAPLSKDEEPPALPSKDAEASPLPSSADNPAVFQNGKADDSQWVFLDYNTYEMSIGDVFQLEAEAELSSEITWSSDNDGIASVSADGTITANGIGTAIITATATAVTEEGRFTGTAACEVTVKNRISLNHNSLVVYVGKAEKLAASLVEEEAITWSSSEPEVVKVNAQGEITPVKAGKATVTAATASGAAESCKVTVKNPSLTLKSKATAYVKGTLKLEATARPSGTVKWESSDPKVAAVNQQGQVSPKKTGTATITATCNGISKKCKVTVKNPSLKIKSAKAAVYEGNTYRLDITARPSEGLKWKSSNSKVATVNETGEVVGKKAGTATLTATLLGKKATCKVEVLENKHKFNRASVTIMKGQSAALQLLNLSENETVYFRLLDDSWERVGCSYSGNTCEITGEAAGIATVQAVYSRYVDGQAVTGVSQCAIKIIDSGIVQQQISIAIHAKKQLKLKNVGKEGLSIVHTAWESSHPKIASIDGNGQITGKASGTAKVAATVTYSDGSTEKFLTTIKVSNPKLKTSSSVMAIGKSKRLKLTGTNTYSTIKWKIGKGSLASIRQDGTVVSNYTTGKTVITVTVDGKTIKHKLAVTNPRLKSSYKALSVGKTTQISVKGASSKKKITYKSKNKSVATVSKSGKVKAKSNGNTEIIVKADGVSLAFKVSVAPQRALSACKKGHQIMYSSTYSQAQRMQNGFYDCSSLVFRAYGKDAGLLGGSSSYAPTAASMAYYLERTGKAISFKGLDASQLLPGDLIFYGDSSNRNGRYKNIYHVSMYYGDGYRLEKPLRYYYPDGNIVLIARPVR